MFRGFLGKAIVTPSSSLTDATLLIGRIFIVIALIPNGFRKIVTFSQTAAGMGGTPQVIDGRAFPEQLPLVFFPMPEFFLGASIVLDLAGALLILIGFQARLIGLVLAGYVLLAMVIYHSDIRGSMDVIHILRNLPFLGGLVMIGGIGAGWWSVDGYLGRKKSRHAPFNS